MSTSILSENFKYRNASYVLDVRTDKEGLLVSVEQTVHHLDGTRTETTITVPTHIVDRLNDLLGRVAEVQKKETEAKDPPVPLNQRGKLAKA